VRRWPLAFALALFAALGVLAWFVLGALRDGSEAEPERAATVYLRAWQRSDWNAMRRLVAQPPADFRKLHEHVFDDLRVERARLRVADARDDGDQASADFDARLSVGGLGEWRYRGRLRLARKGGRWRVVWSPSAIYPALRRGRGLHLVRVWPKRAPIFAADGAPLATERPAVVVGVEPRRIENRRQLLAALARYAGADPRHVTAELNRPGVQPNWFIPVAVLRASRYELVRPALYPVPGTVFRRSRARLAPSEGFASHVLGRVGEITAERLAELGDPYAPGDVVGLSGLERSFERRLAGRPSARVELVDRRGKVLAVLRRFEGREPRPVRTTLALDVQRAAERALARTRQPAALVAVDTRSGAVRAAVSRPDEEFDRALAGHYPPGSTFKIVTTAALLEQNLSPGGTVSCPEQAVVGGKVFRNAERLVLGPIPFRTAFVESCNTAFVQLAAKHEPAALSAAARRFGFGARYQLPLAVAGGRFPRPRDLAEQAAAAIGQGRVEASPLHMATVGAAAATGSWRPPRLLAGSRPSARPAVRPRVAATLRRLLRLVVAEGTGTAAAVPGEPVLGKTGTAEFGTGSRPRTHAWFVGVRGSLAFAVLVEGGGFGGRVAAPIARRFVVAIQR
jgi:cell division protein FtsI/penicillin-binding protein 2